MFKQIKYLALAGTLAGSALVGTPAQAAGWIVGLVDGKSIVTIDPATRKVASKADIKGAGNILGIDVRPADGMIYGVTADGQIVTIDAKSGQAAMKSKLSETLKSGVTVTFDFNPVADRLRLMGSDGTSLRVNVDDGKVAVDGSHKFKDGDANAGKTPEGGGRRLHQFLEGHQGDDAVQHRRHHRHAGDARRRRTTACSTRSVRSA